MNDKGDVRKRCWKKEKLEKESLLISRDGRQERAVKRVRVGLGHRNG